MAFFLKNWSGAFACWSNNFFTFPKIELNLPRHVRDEVLTRTC